MLLSEIVRAEARVVSLPLDKPLAPGFDAVETVLLRLTDADGAAGLGYLWCFGQSESRVLLETLRWLAPFAVGRHELDELLAGLRARMNFFGLKGLAVFGLSAIDMALHDLLCRRQGISLSERKGARRRRVPTYWSGFVPTATLGELEAEAGEASARGFRAIKFRVSTGSLDEDERRLQRVMSRIPGCTVMIDVNQRWTAAETLAAAERFAPYGIRWLEEPIVHNDYPGLARLVQRSQIPIASGENEYLREGFVQLLDTGLPYLLADLQRVGGIAEWETVARLAAERGAVLTSHAYPHVSVHLCACLEQEEIWCEYMPWFDRLFSYELELVDGELVVPRGPGIGMELDEERVEHGAHGPWERIA